MKITYAAATGRLEFNDLGNYIKGVSPQARLIALNAGESMYLAETGDVLLSAQAGDIYKFAKAGKIAVNDTVALAGGGTFTIVHNFNYLPKVTVAKNVAGAWVVATDVTVSTNAAMTQTVVTVVGAATYQIRVS